MLTLNSPLLHYQVRELRSSDQEAILALHNQTFKTKMNAAIFDWKFRQSPEGPALGAVGFYKDQFIGCALAVPIVVRVHHQLYRCYHGTEVMVHPQHQGRYLLKSFLEKLTDQILATNTETALIGYPNESSLLIGTRYLGYEKLLDLRHYQLPLSFVPDIPWRALRKIFHPLDFIYRILKKKKNLAHKVPDGLQIEQTADIPEDYEDFFENAVSKNDILYDRSRKFLTWRYLNHPEKNCRFFTVRTNRRLVGYFVLQEIRKELYILDIFTAKNENFFREILGYSIAHAFKNGQSVLKICTHDPTTENALKEFPFRLRKVSLMVFVREPSVSLEKILRLSNWRLLSGDYELG